MWTRSRTPSSAQRSTVRSATPTIAATSRARSRIASGEMVTLFVVMSRRIPPIAPIQLRDK